MGNRSPFYCELQLGKRKSTYQAWRGSHSLFPFREPFSKGGMNDDHLRLIVYHTTVQLPRAFLYRAEELGLSCCWARRRGYEAERDPPHCTTQALVALLIPFVNGDFAWGDERDLAYVEEGLADLGLSK